MAIPLRLRVFLASPGDVSDERALARQVLERLPYDPLVRNRLDIEIVAWDQPGGGTPMLATMTPQAAIAAGLSKPSECDITVVILWKKMGTPLPEEYRKPQGGKYESGTEWEYLDAVSGAESDPRRRVLVYRRTQKVAFDPDDPDFDEQTAQRRKVTAFFEAFRNSDGSLARGFNSYETPDEFRAALDLHLRDIVAKRLEKEAPQPVGGSASSPVVLPLWQGSPFPGLRGFTPEDEPIFFGRGRETDELVQLLRSASNQFVLVVGGSGSGKSSLVAAGLLPRLKANALEGSKDWLLPDVLPASANERRIWRGLRFTPGELGDNPFLALAAKLAPMLPDHESTPKLAARLEGAPATLGACVDRVVESMPSWTEALIVVDQFEELFFVAERYREAFVTMLVATVKAPRRRIVATLRADFYHRCLEWPEFGALLRSASFPLAAPDSGSMQEMITGPAARAGLEFEKGLTARILNDAGSGPGALALLAFALYELYRARTQEGLLTHTAYDGFGGVRGAITRRAEDAFARLPPSAQAAFSGVLSELVEVDERGVATKRRLLRTHLVSSGATGEFVDSFTDARLLVTDRTPDGEPVIEVAHEALLREWPRFATWIANRAVDLRIWRQTEAAADDWQRGARTQGLLWSHERLTLSYEAADRLGIRRDNLPEHRKAFVRLEAERLVEEATAPQTTHYRRAEIGDRLEQIGDVRTGVGVSPTGVPDIVWCEIPAGRITLEDKAGRFDVDQFLISKYPVTYRQFLAFVDDSEGFTHKRWWKNLDRPKAPPEQFRRAGNCPVDSVSWHDAVAYCRWLSERLGRAITLPTEMEWQRMAMGGQRSREYPWGDEWDQTRANTYESRLNRSTAVGLYPAGATQQGVLDVAGNVWEWCSNRYEQPGAVDYQPTARALRGGSWGDGADGCRSRGRFSYDPGLRLNLLGFRVRSDA